MENRDENEEDVPLEEGDWMTFQEAIKSSEVELESADVSSVPSCEPDPIFSHKEHKRRLTSAEELKLRGNEAFRSSSKAFSEDLFRVVLLPRLNEFQFYSADLEGLVKRQSCTRKAWSWILRMYALKSMQFFWPVLNFLFKC